MTRLGLDFDNTLVRYDKIFHELALEKGLIDDSLPIEKKAIRDYLHKRGEDEEFTLLQGEVYGLRILEAEPAEGMLDAIHKLKEKQVDMTLISHKTRTPYKGPAYDLREMAMQWLEKHNITKILNKNGKENNIHFAETKEEKIKLIEYSRCGCYVDDLEVILKALPDKISKIHYKPTNIYNERSEAPSNKIKVMKNWKEIHELINQ